MAASRLHDLEAQCLHARDFANFANLHARNEKGDQARGEYIEQLKYYDRHIGKFPQFLLPGEYKYERADAKCGLAEMQLDQVESGESVKLLLEEARSEYTVLAKLAAGADALSKMARVHICLARFNHMRIPAVRDKAAEIEAGKAIDIYNKISDDNKAQPVDYYNMAVGYTILGAAQANDPNRVLALDRLDTAIRKGFVDYPRIKRDRCLISILDKNQFESAVERVRKKADELKHKTP